MNRYSGAQIFPISVQQWSYVYIYPRGRRFTGNSCPKGVYIYIYEVGVGLGWGENVLLNLHTWSVLRKSWDGVGLGWGGVGMVTFLALAHKMIDAVCSVTWPVPCCIGNFLFFFGQEWHLEHVLMKDKNIFPHKNEMIYFSSHYIHLFKMQRREIISYTLIVVCCLECELFPKCLSMFM